MGWVCGVLLMIFDVDNSSILVLILVEEIPKFCLSVHYNGVNSYLSVNEKETDEFRDDHKYVNFLAQFCLGSISNGSDAIWLQCYW